MHGDAGVNPSLGLLFLWRFLLFSQALDIAFKRDLVQSSNSDPCRIHIASIVEGLPVM